MPGGGEVRSTGPRRWPGRRLVAALALAACSTGGWAWRRPDGGQDPRQMREDIDACEEYTRIVETGDPFSRRRSPRPYGGWGSFPFEVCMHQRGWELQYVSSP